MDRRAVIEAIEKLVALVDTEKSGVVDVKAAEVLLEQLRTEQRRIEALETF